MDAETLTALLEGGTAGGAGALLVWGAVRVAPHVASWWRHRARAVMQRRELAADAKAAEAEREEREAERAWDRLDRVESRLDECEQHRDECRRELHETRGVVMDVVAEVRTLRALQATSLDDTGLHRIDGIRDRLARRTPTPPGGTSTPERRETMLPPPEGERG